MRFIRYLSRGVAVFLILCVLQGSRAAGYRGNDAETPPPGAFVAGEVLARWSAAPPPHEVLAALDITHTEPVAGGRAARLLVPPGREHQVVRALRARPDVVWAQPNFIREI